MRLAINDILNHRVTLKLFHDSASLFDGIDFLTSTTEKYLLIDLRFLRQSYKRREIAEAIWTPEEKRPVNELTKKMPISALQALLSGKHLYLHLNSEIYRSLSRTQCSDSTSKKCYCDPTPLPILSIDLVLSPVKCAFRSCTGLKIQTFRSCSETYTAVNPN